MTLPHGLQLMSASGMLAHMFRPHDGQVYFVLSFFGFFSPPAMIVLCKIQLPSAGGERNERLLIGAAGNDVVLHSLAGFLAADSARVRRHQAKRLHSHRPFFVVVAVVLALLHAEQVLPQVTHLVQQDRDDPLVGPADEAVGIERHLVLTPAVTDAVGEAVRHKVTARMGTASIVTSCTFGSMPSNSLALRKSNASCSAPYSFIVIATGSSGFFVRTIGGRLFLRFGGCFTVFVLRRGAGLFMGHSSLGVVWFVR